MASMLGGNSILHIANRLGSIQKDSSVKDEMDRCESSLSPSSESIPNIPDGDFCSSINQDGKITLRLFKNEDPDGDRQGDEEHDGNGIIQYASSPSTSVESSRGMYGGNEGCDDINMVISQMKQHINDKQNSFTMRDLLPGYSPWMRNAGRKKSHPVWDFFKDLKDTNGVGGVICLHCTWQGDDRSPNNLRTHLKKFHTNDGIFGKFSQKLAQTPTQPYVKRARAGGVTSRSPAATESMAMALQQLQQSNQSGQHSILNSSLNFLENLPKSSEVINISAGYSNGEEDEILENSLEPGSSSASASGDRIPSTSPSPQDVDGDSPIAQSGGSPSVTSTQSNQFSALMNMAAANPLMWNAMLSANNSSHGSAFSLNDGQCVSMLMKMGIDLDLTLSYHKRRGDIELCFESNRTAEKSGGRGKVLCLSDLGREIRVTERVNGTPTDTEMWTKTDFNQFHWAIRGKCQKVLVKV